MMERSKIIAIMVFVNIVGWTLQISSLAGIMGVFGIPHTVSQRYEVATFLTIFIATLRFKVTFTKG